MSKVMLILAVLVWNVFVLGGAVYMVQFYNWNLGTVVLALFLLASVKPKKSEAKDE